MRSASRHPSTPPNIVSIKSYYIGIPTLSHEMARRKERRLGAIHISSEGLVIFVRRD